MPSRGPIEYLEQGYQTALLGGPILEQIQQSVMASGGNHGAFPSLHVGASLYCSLFDIKVSRLRGWIYLVLVAFIAVSTIVLRYHYVVDLIVGAIFAVLAWRFAFHKENITLTSLPPERTQST